MNVIHPSPSEHREAVLKHFNKSEDDLKEYVRILREWIKTQHHLPEIMSDNRIERFFIVCKCSIEVTKGKIDMYYTMRHLIPEMYGNPKLPHIKEMYDIGHTIPSTKLTEKFGRTIIITLNRTDLEFWDFNHYFVTFFNYLEIRMSEDYILGDHYIFDIAGITTRHIKLISLTALKRAATVLENVFSNRIAGIHIINCLAFVDFFICVAKASLSDKIFKRVHVHKNYASLYKHVPKDILPAEYGGKDLPVEQIRECLKVKLTEYQDRFDILDTLKVDESLRPKKLANDEVLGIYGNFRKLDVD